MFYSRSATSELKLMAITAGAILGLLALTLALGPELATLIFGFTLALASISGVRS